MAEGQPEAQCLNGGPQGGEPPKNKDPPLFVPFIKANHPHCTSIVHLDWGISTPNLIMKAAASHVMASPLQGRSARPIDRHRRPFVVAAAGNQPVRI